MKTQEDNKKEKVLFIESLAQERIVFPVSDRIKLKSGDRIKWRKHDRITWRKALEN